MFAASNSIDEDVDEGPKENNEIPSLVSLCIKAISSNIERYPADAFGILSEDDWDTIVKYRHQSTTPTKSLGRRGGLDGSGRMAPAIPERLIRDIETQNEHLKGSKEADRLVWKDIVEYKYRKGGPSRPKIMEMPWPDLVHQVRELGRELAESLPLCLEDTMTDGQVRLRISDILGRLNQYPISVQLLKATEIGKTTSKLLKSCQKMAGTDISLATATLLSFQPQFHDLLDSWKNLASASGVQVSKSSHVNNTMGDCTLRDKNTSMKQYQKDVELLQTCSTWRELCSALIRRQEKLMQQRGEKLRQVRQNLDSNKHKVKKAKIAQTSVASGPKATLKRLDDKLLSKEKPSARNANVFRRNNVAQRAVGVNMSRSKMALLKRETATAATFTKSTIGHLNGNKKRSGGAFGVAVANLNALEKKKAPTSSGPKASQVFTMSNGKKMKLPSSKTASMLHHERVHGSKR